MHGRAIGRRFLRLWFGLAVLVLAACATGTIRAPYAPELGASPLRPPAADPFPYARGPVVPTNHVEEEGGDYTVRLLALPSVGENGQDGNRITARYFQSTTPERKGLVIIVPIWGGSPYPSSIVARDLVNEGRTNVLLLVGDQMVIDWDAMAEAPTPEAFATVTQRMVDRIRATIIDTRRLMDWAEARPEIDARRIGLIGFSESMWQVAGVMASDRRLAAAVLVMGGARPHEVIAECYGPPAVVRRHVMRRFGWSHDQFVRALEALFEPIDPDRLGSWVDPARVLIIDAHEDDCIPPGAREALWRTLGRPERISVRSSHSGSFLGMTFLGGNHLRTAIGQFFARALR